MHVGMSASLFGACLTRVHDYVRLTRVWTALRTLACVVCGRREQGVGVYIAFYVLMHDSSTTWTLII